MNRIAKIMIALLLLLSALPASAAPGQSENKWKETQEKRRERIMEQAATIWSKTRDHIAVRKYLEAQGLEVLAAPDEGEVGTMSDPQKGEVDLPQPTVTYDPPSGEYYVYYNFAWVGGAWLQDISCTNMCNVGGPDGWGIHLDRNDVIERITQQVTLYGDWGGVTVPAATYPSGTDMDTEGFFIKVQDEGWKEFLSSGYTADHGLVAGWFQKKATFQGTATVKFTSHMAHTWESSYITGISVGADSFGISFDNATWAWDIASAYRTSYTFSN